MCFWKKIENVSGSTVNNLTDDDNDDENERKQTLYNESNTIALLRFCLKCFSCGGDEKCDSYSNFKAFCKEKDEKVLFIPFRGNRFNIIFLIGEIVFYHKDTIRTFLKDVHGANNSLQKMILCLIQKPQLKAACKVLG